MIPSFSKLHNKFKLNREYFNHDQLIDVGYSFIKEGEPYEKVIGTFLLDWLDNRDFVIVNTSGSTGKPKAIKLKKQALVNSAITTGNYFNLEPGFTALHCLPTHFIAGKMMLVRAIILGLELDIVTPSSYPLAGRSRVYDFSAMIPLQLQNSLEDLDQIRTLIVGGAAVSKSLQEKLEGRSTKVYATYGMTETITHIASKPLNHFKETTKPNYKVLPEVSISVDERDCLIINAPNIYNKQIITNDIVKIHSDTEFQFIGRYDNMINSGGIKLFPEQIENKLHKKISQRFFVASEKDETLGERLILVLESDTNTLNKEVFKDLDTYETPKHIYTISHFKETTTGKIQRAETLKLLE